MVALEDVTLVNFIVSTLWQDQRQKKMRHNSTYHLLHFMFTEPSCHLRAIDSYQHVFRTRPTQDVHLWSLMRNNLLVLNINTENH